MREFRTYGSEGGPGEAALPVYPTVHSENELLALVGLRFQAAPRRDRCRRGLPRSLDELLP